MKKLEAQGIKTKRSQDVEPELFSDMIWLWEVFTFLNANGRQQSVDGIPGPILFSEIASYCSLFRIRNEDHIASIVEVVTTLDAIYIDDAIKKRKAAEARRK